nr:MAG TPA: hypothetical protein [Caudoviricetes sp.]
MHKDTRGRWQSSQGAYAPSNSICTLGAGLQGIHLLPRRGKYTLLYTHVYTSVYTRVHNFALGMRPVGLSLGRHRDSRRALSRAHWNGSRWTLAE